MPELALRYEACVRTLAIASSCRACVDACPTDAVRLAPPLGSVVIALDPCTRCGLCAAACPTDAITAPFDLEAILASPPPQLVCGEEGLPCVGALATEDLLAVALRGEDLALLASPRCDHEAGHAAAEARVAEISALLAQLGSPTSVTFGVAPEGEAPAPTPPPEAVSIGRRRLLGALVPPKAEAPSGEKIERPSLLDRTLMQRPTARRQRLLSILPSSVSPDLLPESLSFSSGKELEGEKCTICRICVSVCPTGALRPNRSWRAIEFNPGQCVRCHLCHDVCAPEAITLAPGVSLSDMARDAFERLGRLPVTTCIECGVTFNRSQGEGGLCGRCAEHEREAFELSGGRK